MSSTTESISTIEIFVLFAHEDATLRDELEKHLNILKRQGQIMNSYNREINASREWAHEIDVHIDTSQIILLLLSPDFMNSDYCYGVEMKRALERHEAGEARVIPIILRHVLWKGTPLGTLQALPKDGKPVKSWSDIDEALFSITEGISNVVKELLVSYKIADGDAQYKDEHYDEALAAYEQAILLDTNNAPAYIGKGNTLYYLKRYNEALAAYQRAILLDTDNALTYYNMASTLYYLKRYNEALAAYEWAILLDTNDAFSYNGKGNTLRSLRRYDAALEAYEQAIRLDPRFALAYNGKGNALYGLKRYNEALDAYEQAIRLTPNNDLLYSNKGNTFRNLKRYDEALAAYERAILLAPFNAPAYYHKGNTLYNLKRYEEALTAYEQAIHLDPSYAAAYNGKGITLYQLKRSKLALAAYEQAILLAPNDASVYYNKGTSLYHLKWYKLALPAYEQAIRLDPSNVSAYNGKGNTLRSLRRYEAALEAYEQAIRLDPRFALAYNNKGDILYQLKRYEEAARTYEQAIFLDPSNVSAYMGKGNALYHLKRYLEAARTYEQAIFLDPSNVSAYMGKGNALNGLRRYEIALEAYEQAIFLDPSNVSAYLNKGNALYNLKRYDDALAAYDEVIRIAPNNSSAYLNKGNALYDLKRYNDALAAYNQATLLAPDEATGHFNKGLSLENLTQYEEALAAYKQAKCLNPNIELANSQGLLARIKSAQEFLMKAGFDLSETYDPFALGFLVLAKKAIWHERFPTGLYVRILFDHTLDQSTVRNIHLEAKPFSNCALVLINQQPAISGWMAIAGLRLEDTERFIFLQMDESLIKEGLASNQEYQTLSLHVNKHLGKDFDPFDARYPVSDAVSFFGRESLTDEITNALKLGQSLGLFGLHKMGKSSVLQRLQKKADFPTAYVYLRKGDSLEGIYKRILEGWLIDIRIKYPGLKWFPPQITTNADSKMIFDSAAKNLLMSLGNFTNTPLLAIFLDEIESISPYQDGDEVTLRLYMNLVDSLRGLQQETNNLSLLIAGVHPIVARRNYFWGNQKNPLHQVISERFLLPLEKEDCNYMIRSLGQQINLTYDDEVLEYILRMSGAHPFLARQVCSLAYKSRGNIDTVSIQIIQKTAQDFVNNPATASYFDDYGLWGELGKQDIWGEEISYANHKILSSLAASSVELAEDEISSSLNKKVAERALAALTERGIINTVDGSRHYYITFGLFRDWIRLHKLGME